MSALELVTRYVELARRARAERTSAAWEALAPLWADDVEIRVADGRGGATWRVTARGRAAALERLCRSEVDATRLATRTVRSFSSDDGTSVVVEQISELTGDDGNTTSVPVCHVFEVEDGCIRRQSIYRNEA